MGVLLDWMTCELAKELRRAGFPQEEKDGVLLDECVKTEDGTDIVEGPYAPTLSELIDACGHWAITHGEGMEAYRMEIFGGQVEQCRGWEARLSQSLFGDWNANEHGETPEEAVAHLWLALNKK